MGFLLPAAVLGLAYAVVRRQGPSAPSFLYDARAEGAGADQAVATRPARFDGRRRGAEKGETDWLGWVAYRIAYPLGPKEPRVSAGVPADPALLPWLQAQTRIRALVAARLGVAWTRSSPNWPLASRPIRPGGGSAFGVRRPWRKSATPERHHAGVDLAAPLGTPVLAPEAGTVVGETGWDSPARALLLHTDTGLTVLLGGIEAGSGPPPGTRVEACQPVARVGLYPGGSHMLHFQLYGRVLTEAEVEKRKRWPWSSATPPDALVDPSEYIALAAQRPCPGG